MEARLLINNQSIRSFHHFHHLLHQLLDDFSVAREVQLNQRSRSFIDEEALHHHRAHTCLDKGLSQILSFQPIFLEVNQAQVASLQVIDIQLREHLLTEFFEQFKVAVDVVDWRWASIQQLLQWCRLSPWRPLTWHSGRPVGTCKFFHFFVNFWIHDDAVAKGAFRQCWRPLCRSWHKSGKSGGLWRRGGKWRTSLLLYRHRFHLRRHSNYAWSGCLSAWSIPPSTWSVRRGCVVWWSQTAWCSSLQWFDQGLQSQSRIYDFWSASQAHSSSSSASGS